MSDDDALHRRIGAAEPTVRGVVGHVGDVTARIAERRTAHGETVGAQRRDERARDVIDALQRELLPAGVPVVPHLDIAAAYLPADTAAGGDWFDAAALSGGRVGLVVGDVVGHGVPAATVMGQLRVLLTHHLAETGDVALALEAVDCYAERVRGARSATACVVVLDPASGTLTYCTAGHPPPLIVPADGEPRYLAPTGSGPLATSADFSLGHDRLGPGDLVLLYTNGILQRPGRDPGGASAELARVAADIAAGRAPTSTDPTTVERVAAQTPELLTRATGHTDDITLLAAQRVAPVDGFAVRATAVADTVAEVRAALQAWLDAVHAGVDDALALQHAVAELVANAVEHAYRDAAQPGPVSVVATLTRSGEVRVEVRDKGRWREPTPSSDRETGRGRGLRMVDQLVDELVIEHPDSATVAFMRRQLLRPARLLTTDTPAPRPVRRATAPSGSLVIDEQTPDRLSLTGPVDHATAPALADALRRATVAGTLAVTVDLTGVTHLASAGVSVLHEADARSLANGTQLRLHTAAGAPADQILTLAALPHTTQDPHPGRSDR